MTAKMFLIIAAAVGALASGAVCLHHTDVGRAIHSAFGH